MHKHPVTLTVAIAEDRSRKVLPEPVIGLETDRSTPLLCVSKDTMWASVVTCGSCSCLRVNKPWVMRRRARETRVTILSSARHLTASTECAEGFTANMTYPNASSTFRHSLPRREINAEGRAHLLDNSLLFCTFGIIFGSRLGIISPVVRSHAIIPYSHWRLALLAVRKSYLEC